MSEFKGTPAPWSVEHDEIVSESGLTICVIGCETSEERLEANASLIASAPQLLAALQLMVSTYPYSPPCHGWESQVEAHVAAKQAIAKALGK